MDLHTLHKLVSQGEGLQLEFKRKLPELHKLIKEAIALANTEGGYLLIGVDDDGSIHGLKDPDEAEESFQQAIDRHCKPAISYLKQRISITAKRTVVAFRIPKSKRKPHRLFLPNEGKKGVTYVRVADESIRASQEVFFILRNQSRSGDVKIEYGPKEEILMKYLAEHPEITVREFAKLASISRYIASRTLVHLVRGNVLKIRITANADYFQLAFA